MYAIGDLLGSSKIMLAHVASAEGMAAAENAMGGQRDMDYSAVPGAISTSPEIANVGLTQAQALEQGYEVRSDTVFFRSLSKAQVIGDIASLPGYRGLLNERQKNKSTRSTTEARNSRPLFP
jgi:dihydrolipoamide dehydrogenase